MAVIDEVAVVSAVYRWACRPSRRATTGVSRNRSAHRATRGGRAAADRVADAAEAELLLPVLAPDDQVPFAPAFYAGLRRAEIARLRWEDVELDGYRLTVCKAKTDAGTLRRPPIAEPLKPILRRRSVGRAQYGHWPQPWRRQGSSL